MFSASLLGQAVQKLPPNMKEAWSMHTVKRSLDRPTSIDFNDWLKDKAEAHERMKTASGNVKGDKNVPNTATKTKKTSKVFAATASTNQVKSKPENIPTICVACKKKQPMWKCPVFRTITPTERAKLVADNELCFSCFRTNHSFRQSPQSRKCTKEDCESSHNTFLHGAERIFQRKSETPIGKNPETSTCIGTTKMNDQVAESSGMHTVRCDGLQL